MNCYLFCFILLLVTNTKLDHLNSTQYLVGCYWLITVKTIYGFNSINCFISNIKLYFLYILTESNKIGQSKEIHIFGIIIFIQSFLIQFLQIIFNLFNLFSILFLLIII